MRHLVATLAAFLPTLALAQAEAAPVEAGSPYTSLLPLLLIFVVFYFFLIKPQQKRLKEHQSMQTALKKGDEVVTGGGIIGRITKAGEGDSVIVEIAKGVEVVVLKSSISTVIGAPKAEVASKKKSGKSGNVKNDNAVPSRDSVANDN
ncbi:MAG: preprotein translocase subunit YajC [Pseudomonadota bacterium]